MTPSRFVADTLLVHAGFVQRLARGLAGAGGDDLAQETWTAALQAPVGDVHSLRSWLATIAANLWRNGQRTVLRRVRREAAAGTATNCPSVLEILEREEVRRQVVAAVVDLPERLRRVVLLRFYEGLDSFAIGRRLDVPASTVRAQLQKALALLRQRLDGAHGDRRAAWALPLAGWLKAPVGSWFGTLLRVVWPVRAFVGALAVLLLTWLTVPLWLGSPSAPPPPRVGPGEVAVAEREKPAEGTAPPPLRESVAAAAVSVERGPEDLWGRVVAAADGTPVAGAELVLEHRDADEFTCIDLEHDKRIEIIGTTHSDAEGRFAFRVQRAWQHRLVARAPGLAPAVTMQCTGGSEVVVQMARPASIDGTVRRKDDVAPLGDVLVEVLVRGGWYFDSVSARTAADGTFFLGGLAPLSSYLVARPVGMLAPEWNSVTLEPGQNLHVDIAVERGQSLRGVVRDGATKEPIGDARIATSWTMGDAVRSAADGTFELQGLDEREEVHVRAVGYAPLARSLTAADAEKPLELVLSRGNVVVGRVVDTTGRAVLGTYVAAVTSQWTGRGGMHTHWLVGNVAADGRFRIEGLAAEWARADGVVNSHAWQLLVRAPCMGNLVLALPAEPLRRGVLDVGHVVLEAQAILEGRLVEEDGQAIAGAEVTLTGHAAAFGRLLSRQESVPSVGVWHLDNRSTRTAGDGTFRFAGLAGGSYSLRAEMEGDDWEAKSGPVAVRDGEVVVVPDVVLAKGLAIEGVVRIPGMRELAADEKLALTAALANGLSRSATVGRDGTFRIGRLEAGDYQLHAMDVPAGFAMVPRRVAAGTKGLELELVVASSLEGRVVDHEGKPVPRASVCFFAEGVSSARNSFTDAEGRFRLEVAPGVRGKVSAMHPDQMMRQAQVKDVEAPRQDLELTLPR